jgi:SSS family solute:Na+ symporter
MNIYLFLSLFSILGLIYFMLGLAASKKVATTKDYFLAGRDLGLWPVTFTLIATQLGGGMLLGTAQEAYSVGYYGLLYTVGMSIGFIILGLGFAARLQSLNVATTAELFETRYGSITLKKIASLLSIITLLGITVGQIVASRALLNGLELNNEVVFLLFWAGLIVYTMVGGLKAVVVTDTAQLLVIVVIFGGIFLASLFAEPCSFFSCTALAEQQANFSGVTMSWSTIVAIILMPALFSLIEQDLAQRFFASRTKRVAALSALFAGIFMLLFALIPIYFGIKAKLLGMVIPVGTSPLIPVLTVLTSEFAVLLAVCGIIAAITSTASSLLCAISSNITQDFDFSWLGLTNKFKLSHYITALVGITALAMSYLVSQNIIGILISSYELSVCCLLIPLVVSYYKTNLNKYAAYGAIMCGLAGFIVFRFYEISLPKELVTLGLSALGFVLGNFIKR